MKKKFVIVNAIVGMAVLFSILFQSLHGFEHLAKQLSQKKCVHQHHSTAELTHQHHNFDHCLICEIVFSNSIPAENIPFQYQFAFEALPYFITFQTRIITSFSGSNYSLRGPPLFIV